MILTSFTFLIFCFITLLIYFIIPKKHQWIVLLISSIIFLFWDNFNLWTIIQALVVLLPTYFFGILIEKYNGTNKSKKFLIYGILIILGQLIYLKYTNFLIETLNYIFNLFKINFSLEYVYRNSLIGISYYSLIMISYLIDIYRGAFKSQRNIFKCALFMSYFPILISGPFIRYDSIKDDLYGNHKFNYKNLCYGLLRIFWGLFKILAISQRLGYFVDTVYSNLNTYTGIYTVIAILFFTLQLFTNFSGLIDVIMGISEILGIKLPENFELPFFSRTITEFWRRWHITLGAWLRDYIFYPLLKSNFMQNLNKKYQKRFGKRIGKKITLYLSLLIMWILIGIWHGGEYKFIVGSGLLQYIYMIFEDLLSPLSKNINNKLKIDSESFGYKLYQYIKTFVLFSFSLIFFRALNINNAIQIIRNIFICNKQRFNINLLLNTGLNIREYVLLIISFILFIIIGILGKNGDVREKIFKQNIIVRWGIIYALVFGVIIFGCYGVGYDPVAFFYREF